MQILLIDNETDRNNCATLMCQSEPWVTLNFDLERCRQSLMGDHKEVYMVKVDGVFAGFVVLLLYGVLRGYIQTICIEPAYRNMGMGSALIKFSEDRIRRMSPNVFICVSSFNHKAQALYYKLGFEKVGLLQDHLVKGYDELILRKSTGPLIGFQPL